MKDSYVECPELSGKTIQSLRLYKDSDATEIQIQFTDGTSFACSVCHSAAVTASLFKGGVGTPEILRTYQV